MAKKCTDKKCCCRCDFQERLRCHPCNNKIGKGPMSKTLGYACHGLNVEDNTRNELIFYENKHGECELFTIKRKRRISANNKRSS